MEDDKQSLLLEIYWRAFNDRQQFIAHKFPVDKFRMFDEAEYY